MANDIWSINGHFNLFTSLSSSSHIHRITRIRPLTHLPISLPLCIAIITQCSTFIHSFISYLLVFVSFIRFWVQFQFRVYFDTSIEFISSSNLIKFAIAIHHACIMILPEKIPQSSTHELNMTQSEGLPITARFHLHFKRAIWWPWSQMAANNTRDTYRDRPRARMWTCFCQTSTSIYVHTLFMIIRHVD
jgi:hypothetical protein